MSVGIFAFLRLSDVLPMALQLFGSLLLGALLYFGSAPLLRIPEVSEIFLLRKAEKNLPSPARGADSGGSVLRSTSPAKQ